MSNVNRLIFYEVRCVICYKGGKFKVLGFFFEGEIIFGWVNMKVFFEEVIVEKCVIRGRGF